MPSRQRRTGSQPDGLDVVAGAAADGALRNWTDIFAAVSQPVLLLHALERSGPEGTTPLVLPEDARATASLVSNCRCVAVEGNRSRCCSGMPRRPSRLGSRNSRRLRPRCDSLEVPMSGAADSITALKEMLDAMFATANESSTPRSKDHRAGTALLEQYQKYIADQLAVNDDVLQNLTKLMMSSWMQVVTFQRKIARVFSSCSRPSPMRTCASSSASATASRRQSTPHRRRLARCQLIRRRSRQSSRTIREEIAGRIERRHGSRPIVTAEQTLESLGIDSLDVHELVDELESRSI